MIALELEVRASENARTELLQTLDGLRREHEAEGSCTACEVFERVDHRNHFLWLERWRTREDLERHLGTDRFRVLLGAIQVLGELGGARWMTEGEPLRDIGLNLRGQRPQ